MSKKKIKISKRFLRLMPWLWMLIIFYASSRQKIAISQSFWLSFLLFKSLHVIEYGVLFLLWAFALNNKPYSIEASILISSVYGIIDETHQTFVPTRQGRVQDVIIDITGILIFWAFVLPKAKKLFNQNFKVVNQ